MMESGIFFSVRWKDKIMQLFYRASMITFKSNNTRYMYEKRKIFGIENKLLSYKRTYLMCYFASDKSWPFFSLFCIDTKGSLCVKRFGVLVLDTWVTTHLWQRSCYNEKCEVTERKGLKNYSILGMCDKSCFFWSNSDMKTFAKRLPLEFLFLEMIIADNRNGPANLKKLMK